MMAVTISFTFPFDNVPSPVKQKELAEPCWDHRRQTDFQKSFLNYSYEDNKPFDTIFDTLYDTLYDTLSPFSSPLYKESQEEIPERLFVRNIIKHQM